jgi:hypothetical protein
VAPLAPTPTAFSLVAGSRALIRVRSWSACACPRWNSAREPTGHDPSVMCRRSMFASSPKAFARQRRTVSAFRNPCPIRVVSAKGRNATEAGCHGRSVHGSNGSGSANEGQKAERLLTSVKQPVAVRAASGRRRPFAEIYRRPADGRSTPEAVAQGENGCCSAAGRFLFHHAARGEGAKVVQPLPLSWRALRTMQRHTWASVCWTILGTAGHETPGGFTASKGEAVAPRRYAD